MHRRLGKGKRNIGDLKRTAASLRPKEKEGWEDLRGQKKTREEEEVSLGSK